MVVPNKWGKIIEVGNMTYTTHNAQQLSKHIKQHIDHIDVVVCIGTDRVVCDSLGPMVGSALNYNMDRPLYIYGIESQCLTALNIVNSFSAIKSLHPNSTILAIDAGVGESGQIGNIQFSDHGILPGLATNRQLPCIGDVGIVGIVSNRDMGSFYADTPQIRSMLDGMCHTIVEGINMAIKI